MFGPFRLGQVIVTAVWVLDARNFCDNWTECAFPLESLTNQSKEEGRHDIHPSLHEVSVNTKSATSPVSDLNTSMRGQPDCSSA